MKHIIMLASENDALQGGKVGGVGDVVRDLPIALTRAGWRITVITPAYGFLHTQNPSTLQSEIVFPFRGQKIEGEFWQVTPKSPHENILHLAFEHPEIRGEPIYCNDLPEHAFARDATKYALFCSAVGQFLLHTDQRSVLHLHDWHTGILFLLRELHPDFVHLKDFKTVFTIHNVAIQGTRPMKSNHDSVESWFPELFKKNDWLPKWSDKRFDEATFTPMAAGLRCADKVNTVSPSYAEEIIRPSDQARGFVGGEGLEHLAESAKIENRLFGILNGCEYPLQRTVPRMSSLQLYDLVVHEARLMNEKSRNHSQYDLVMNRVERIKEMNPSIIFTSVTRVVEQKVKLLFEESSRGVIAIDELMAELSSRNGLYILLGSGTTDYEERLMESFRKHERLLFFKGYSDPLGQALYANGTVFLMPSSFEPCGISQMIAMRDGQPCMVHAVGGLKDTVVDGVNGFHFRGSTITEQVDQLIEATKKIIAVCLDDPHRWAAIRAEAARARFTWASSAKQYIDLLYGS